MSKKYYIIFLLFVTSIHLFSQEGKGKLYLNVQPDTAIVKLDSVRFYTFKTPLELDTGYHFIQAWAPTLKYYEKRIHVSEGKQKTLGIGLPYCEAYKKYLTQTMVHKTVDNSFKYAIIPLTTIYGVFSIVQTISYDKQLKSLSKEANAYQSQYDNSVTINTTHRNRIDFRNTKYDYETLLAKRNRFVRYSYVAVFSGIGFSYLFIKLTKNIHIPEYKEKPLLSLTRVNLTPNTNEKLHLIFNF